MTKNKLIELENITQAIQENISNLNIFISEAKNLQEIHNLLYGNIIKLHTTKNNTKSSI